MAVTASKLICGAGLILLSPVLVPLIVLREVANYVSSCFPEVGSVHYFANIYLAAGCCAVVLAPVWVPVMLAKELACMIGRRFGALVDRCASKLDSWRAGPSQKPSASS